MALSYIGGKSKIGKWIVPFYDKKMETYIEVFGGMFWCYFNMNLEDFPNLTKVIYNDFNRLNYNLFECLKNPAEFQKNLDSIPVQQLGVLNTPTEFKERFNQYQRELFSEGIKIISPDYQIASKYAYVLTQVFSGSKPETSSFIDLKGKYRSKYLSFRDKLSKPSWVDHFLKISSVQNEDFQKIIEQNNNPSTYLYLDPPYWKTENYYSNHDFNRNDHERLSNVLNNFQGKFSLSYYDFDLLHEWYPEDKYRWERKVFPKAASATKNKKQNLGEEILILNYT